MTAHDLPKPADVSPASVGDPIASEILRRIAKGLERESKAAANKAREAGGFSGMVDVAEAGAVMRVARVIWNAAIELEQGKSA